jgi:hypothetical protein
MNKIIKSFYEQYTQFIGNNDIVVVMQYINLDDNVKYKQLDTEIGTVFYDNDNNVTQTLLHVEVSINDLLFVINNYHLSLEKVLLKYIPKDKIITQRLKTDNLTIIAEGVTTNYINGVEKQIEKTFFVNNIDNTETTMLAQMLKGVI